MGLLQKQQWGSCSMESMLCVFRPSGGAELMGVAGWLCPQHVTHSAAACAQDCGGDNVISLSEAKLQCKFLVAPLRSEHLTTRFLLPVGWSVFMEMGHAGMLQSTHSLAIGRPLLYKQNHSCQCTLFHFLLCHLRPLTSWDYSLSCWIPEPPTSKQSYLFVVLLLLCGRGARCGYLYSIALL